MRVRRSFAVLLTVCGACAACGGSGSSGSSLLAAREFQLDSAQGFDPVADTTVRVSFDEDGEGATFDFYTGCNHFSGHYRWSAGRLLLRSPLSSTEIGCDGPLAQQEAWLEEFFGASPRMTLEGDTLTFEGDDATLVFVD